MVGGENIDFDEGTHEEQRAETEEYHRLRIAILRKQALQLSEERCDQHHGKQDQADQARLDDRFDEGVVEMEAGARTDIELLP